MNSRFPYYSYPSTSIFKHISSHLLRDEFWSAENMLISFCARRSKQQKRWSCNWPLFSPKKKNTPENSWLQLFMWYNTIRWVFRRTTEYCYIVMEWYRSGHNEHDWKSCDGQKPSEGSNPSHSARKQENAKMRSPVFSARNYRVIDVCRKRKTPDPRKKALQSRRFPCIIA